MSILYVTSYLSGTAAMRMTAACLTWHCKVCLTWSIESKYTTHIVVRKASSVLSLTVSPLPPRKFCAQPVQSHGAFCEHLSEGRTESSLRVIEGNRRRMGMDVRLENKGENAYNARLNITFTPNLRFSNLIVKVHYRHPWQDDNIFV